jgi:hypothetical protein
MCRVISEESSGASPTRSGVHAEVEREHEHQARRRWAADELGDPRPETRTIGAGPASAGLLELPGDRPRVPARVATMRPWEIATGSTLSPVQVRGVVQHRFA